MRNKIKYVIENKDGTISLHKKSHKHAKYFERTDRINFARTDKVCPKCKVENTIFNTMSGGGSFEYDICAKCALDVDQYNYKKSLKILD